MTRPYSEDLRERALLRKHYPLNATGAEDAGLLP